MSPFQRTVCATPRDPKHSYGNRRYSVTSAVEGIHVEIAQRLERGDDLCEAIPGPIMVRES